MPDLDQALGDIRNIRLHLAGQAEFRGFGPLTLSLSAAIAVLAGAAQARWIPGPALHPAQYAALWLGTGCLCAALILTEMHARAARLHSGIANQMVRAAVLQFLPAGAAGLLLPFVMLRAVPQLAWMLPGLWQIVFALGVFAGCRSLPRPMFAVGGWFLLSGFCALSLGGTHALAPLVMAGDYAFGMVIVALIHYVAGRRFIANEAEEI